MNVVATALLFDKNNKLLIYLRDNKPSIPYPNHWDLFGGFLEDGETPEQALKREIYEELRARPTDISFYRKFVTRGGDSQPNTKHVYVAHLSEIASELVLQEGQELRAIDLDDWTSYHFANILGGIVGGYATISEG